MTYIKSKNSFLGDTKRMHNFKHPYLHEYYILRTSYILLTLHIIPIVTDPDRRNDPGPPSTTTCLSQQLRHESSKCVCYVHETVRCTGATMFTNMFF